MYALVCLSVLACALAAPFRSPSSHYHPYHHHHDSYLDGFMGDDDDVFDTARFFNDFQKDMAQLDAMIAELMKHFPSQTTSGLQGNQYKLNINLNGFDEKDITVKAKEGLVMVQAVHKTEDNNERNYLDIRSLPSFVKADSGSWTYAEGLLKVVFDVQESVTSTSTTEVAEVAEPTQAPDREEIESHEDANTNQDADVGVRGDNEIVDNEIPKGDNAETVEATTYAVNFNNEVEFVPARLNRVSH